MQNLKTNFLKQEDNVVYFFNPYYESTRKWDNYILTKNNIVTTYKEIDDIVVSDIKEYEDIIDYKIFKKYLNCCVSLYFPETAIKKLILKSVINSKFLNPNLKL